MEEVYPTEEEIADVSIGRSHLVILGAGASRQAFPDGDRNGKRLPVMNDFVELLEINELIANAGFDPLENFETIYSRLMQDVSKAAVVAEIEQRVDQYFAEMELPDQPTIYDHLVLSLRPKDVIATFNWDPFLYDACSRNSRVAGLPKVAYLHGNVRIGFCEKDRIKSRRGARCHLCDETLKPSRLLFPVEKKDYASAPFISAEWGLLHAALKNALVLTIFGYSAPTSDVEAIDSMSQAWGNLYSREMEQIELIDILSEKELIDRWERFVFLGHSDVVEDYYDSAWLATHPRRSIEAAWQTLFEARFTTPHPLPKDADFPELYEWLNPLIEVEKRADLGV